MTDQSTLERLAEDLARAQAAEVGSVSASAIEGVWLSHLPMRFLPGAHRFRARRPARSLWLPEDDADVWEFDRPWEVDPWADWLPRAAIERVMGAIEGASFGARIGTFVDREPMVWTERAIVTIWRTDDGTELATAYPRNPKPAPADRVRAGLFRGSHGGAGSS